MVRSVHVLPPLPPRRADPPARPHDRHAARPCRRRRPRDRDRQPLEGARRGAERDPRSARRHRHRPDGDAHGRGGRRRRPVRRRWCARRPRGEPGRRDRSVEARQGRHAIRARLLSAGGAADVHAGAGERDRRARRRRSGLGRTDIAGGAPGREGAEDRREHPDRRRPDRREPRHLAADRGRAGEDPGLPHEARLPGSGPGTGAESPGTRAAASAAGKAATSGSAAARSRNASPSGCGASERRSRRRARRCSRCSTRPRPTSRASRTRSVASSWATRRWASSPLHR